MDGLRVKEQDFIPQKKKECVQISLPSNKKKKTVHCSRCHNEICISQLLFTDFTVQHPNMLWMWDDGYPSTAWCSLRPWYFWARINLLQNIKVASTPISKVICLKSPLPKTMPQRGGRHPHTQRHSLQWLILIWGLRGPKSVPVPSCTRAGASTVMARSLIACKSLSQKCAWCRSSGSSGQSKSNFILSELQMQFLLLHPGKSTAAKLSSHGGFTKVIF